MNIRVAAAAALLAVSPGLAAAQEFKGAELSIEALAVSDGDDVASTTYRGSVEAGIYGGFGLAVDLSFYDLGEDDGVRNFTLHALNDAFEFATVGLFYAHDSVDGSSAETFGIEAGRSFGPGGVEGFVGFGSDEGEDFRVLGVDGTLDLTPSVSLVASAATLDLDDASTRRLSLGGEYRFGGRGPALYAELGRLRVEDEALDEGGSENFVGIGARVALGPNRGTTFESRGVYEVIAGF